MKVSLFMSLKKLDYKIVRLGPGWPGLSEMWAYNDDDTLDAVYLGDRKTLVYTGLDREDRRRLERVAAELNLPFAYPLEIYDDRITCCIDGEINIAKHARNVAFHELIVGKQ